MAAMTRLFPWGFLPVGPLGAHAELSKSGSWSLLSCLSPWVAYPQTWAAVSWVGQEGGEGS